MNSKTYLLLPRKFRLLSLFLFIAAILVAFSNLYIDYNTEEKELLKFGSQSLLIFSMFILAITQFKSEDELTILIRMKAFIYSFIFIVGFAVISPFVEYLLNGELKQLSTFQILVTMHLVYFLGIYSERKKVE